MFAGHSIGEYAALTAAGILSVADGAQLVKLRGELMAESGQAAPGGMSAVLGLDASVIAQVLSEVSGTVVVANDNCPGQVVISGEIEAIGIATPLLQAAGAKRVIALNVSGAFHSPLMADAAARLGVALKNIDFQPGKTVYSNVTAQPVADTGQWNDLLEQQLLSPVRWTESVQNLISAGVNTFIECGSGEVLSGLVKRTDKTVATHSVQDVDSLHATVEALK